MVYSTHYGDFGDVTMRQRARILVAVDSPRLLAHFDVAQ